MKNRCPNCGRYIENEPDGYYDREYPYEDGDQVVCYCDEKCCNEMRKKVACKVAHDEGADITDGATDDEK